MDLKNYLIILWRRKWIIILTPVITLAMVIIGTAMMTPKYVASTTIRISTENATDIRTSQIDYVERLMNTYMLIARSRPILDELGQRLQVAVLPEMGVGFPANTELMKVSATDQNPVLAAQAANTLAEILIDHAKRARAERSFVISIVEPANVPKAPVFPQWPWNLALGVAIGVVGGLGLAFLFENLDTTLYTTQQIESTIQLSTLAQIPLAKKRKQVTFLNGNSAEGEAFRHLRTHVLFPYQGEISKKLMITSARPREGKSTIVANLAYAMAQAGRKVVVIDGDMRLPTIHKIFNLSNEIGLSSILKEEIPLAEAIQESQVPGTCVLTSGPSPANPAELLCSPRMMTLLEQLAEDFDLVLLDSPAIMAVTDAAILAPMVDGVIFVVGRAQVRQETVQTALQQLTKVKANIVGMVVNLVNQDHHYDYYKPSKVGSR